MGATAITVNGSYCIGGLRATRGTISLSTSYATGGDTVSTTNLGLSSMYLMLHEYHRDGLLFAYSYNNNTIQAFYPQGENAPSGTGIGTMTFSTQAPTGASAMTASSPWPVIRGVMTAGSGLEVQATADLSSKVLSFIAIGY